MEGGGGDPENFIVIVSILVFIFKFRFKTETRMELKCQNVFQQIRRREYGLKQGPRSKIEILKTLILDVSIAFQSKFTRHEIKLSESEDSIYPYTYTLYHYLVTED